MTRPSPEAVRQFWQIVEEMPVELREELFRELEMFPPDYYAAGIDFTDTAALQALIARTQRELAEIVTNGLQT